MKVLWFSNSPCGSVRRFSNGLVKGGGWLISLEDELKRIQDIHLEVAFFSSKEEPPFIFEGIKYYPMNKNIFNQKYSINRIIERYLSIEKKDKKAIDIMLNIVKRSKPDIIHIHGTEESFGLITNYIKDIPIVFSIQGLIAPYKEKYFTGVPQSEAQKYESIKDKLKHTSISDSYKSITYRANREISYLKKCQYVFGRTFWDYNCTMALNPHREYYTVNEILRPPFYIKRWKGFIVTSKIQIVSTLSNGIYKGFETILKTCTLLQQYSDLKFEWHIIGYTKNNKMVTISQKYTGIQSKNCNIVFHGKLEEEALSNLLCQSDIYVHVAHIENSPNSVCEAMLVGMPVIASYAGGTASLLEHEKEGILYQDGDPYVLAGSIIKMTQDTERAKLYAYEAHKRASIRHNKTNVINEILNGYNEIINDFKKTY